MKSTEEREEKEREKNSERDVKTREKRKKKKGGPRRRTINRVESVKEKDREEG